MRKPSRSPADPDGSGRPAPRRSRAAAAPEDDGAKRFDALAARARADLASFRDGPALARAAGASTGAVTALFLTHAHAAPSAWLLRERAWAGASRLLSSDASVGDVARAVGFGSEAAFRRAFASVVRMRPEAYRAMRREAAFELELPARYRAADVLAYHGRDPASPSERVTGSRLVKAVTTLDGPAVLEIELGRDRARVQLHTGKRVRAGAGKVTGASDASQASPAGASAGAVPGTMHYAHQMALRLLGLTADVRGFEAFARRDPTLAPLVAKRRGLHLPLTATTFEGLAWAILGQQINLAFAFGLRREVLELAGERVGDLIAHPTPARLAALDVETLRRRRFSRAKAEYLLDTAAVVAAGALDTEALGGGSAVAAERALTQLRGIGTWTARYALMRGTGFADAAPVGDVALAAALEHASGADRRPTADEVDGLMRRFSPYRSLATFHLWAGLKDREKGR